MSQRYENCFAALAEKNQGAFVPFIALGDPTRELSLKIVDCLVAAGADALELGIPFSDPVADGPTIQDASTRALENGTNPDNCFEMLAEIRAKYPELPIGLLLYANLVFSNGIDRFYQRCAEAGVDSLLIADVPVEESAPYREAAAKYNIHPIFIAPPNGDEQTMELVGKYGGGYTYLLSRAGVTGAETKAGKPVESLLANLNKYQAPPALLGFGISEPAQVQEAIAAGAAGAISGSAVVKIIERNLNDEAALLAEMDSFIRSMKAATQK
ncbi:tryptophan synthase subunit alpha [Motilimonas sp. 1_MG-2023]|uniref:tryptophan synthase subunit alpha n=1 Tax=Motilimonas TaxID=1914248 RepID=UPI0026E1EE5F|nr:tryptophan synthase subunit alpha [Motilimonas sp. 1_MG-2023]MDO6528026.1 tryptophan synthase subunit alpha [Motilimonas sp. 1_MG-2023]